MGSLLDGARRQTYGKPIKILPWYDWRRLHYPRADWDSIHDLPAEHSRDWRLVRFGRGKLGVVPAESVPEIPEGKILWLTQVRGRQPYRFYVRRRSGWAGRNMWKREHYVG